MQWLSELWKDIQKWWRKRQKKRPRPINNFILELLDMNIRGTWTLPTLREAGGLLPVEEISHSFVEASIDVGNSWAEIARVDPAQVQEFFLQDAAPGEWQFRGTVVDTDGRASAFAVGNVIVPDESAPQPMTDFTITLE